MQIFLLAYLSLYIYPYFESANFFCFASISGEWVKLLQTVCGPAMIRHMRSIKNALLNLVDSSTLKVAAEGPLNLRDMQQLASSQSELRHSMRVSVL